MRMHRIEILHKTMYLIFAKSIFLVKSGSGKTVGDLDIKRIASDFFFIKYSMEYHLVWNINREGISDTKPTIRYPNTNWISSAI